MQGLPVLIRLARQRADERRIALAAAEQARIAAETEIARHEAGMAAETARLGADPESLGPWTLWMRQARQRRGRMLAALAPLLAEEEGLRAALRQDFAEIKRLELALAARDEAAARKAARKQEQRMEEAALLRRGMG